MGIGDDFVLGKIDDILKRLVGSFPGLTHEDTVDRLFLNECVELLDFVVDASGIHIHHIWKV